MILVTGGAGYIGSHTAVVLLEAGFNIIVVDNLCNSSAVAIDRIAKITGKAVPFIKGDIRDESLLNQVFTNHSITAVIHFAGLKAVGESMQKPLDYFDNNIAGTVQLLKVMQAHQVYQLVFSSSATVYGDNENCEFVETMPLAMPTNNYGYTKLVIEQMLEKMAQANPDWAFANLRYFNPIGAHASGWIGEDPQGIPNNLLPYIAQVAVGKLPYLNIFGDDYPTPDGTAIRDYLHVMDLAHGHVRALQYLQGKTGNFVWNLGTGQGQTVKKIVQAFELVTGINIPYQIAPRRAGDIAAFWANANKAKDELNWQTEYSLETMIRDLWNWQSKNPDGY
ncbi:UDP-glucose 4-epimerase GalE [Alkanindiges sp. WGS2144]|uniref:UDP-glucose 4-epimerase GalE n=1 Tax=Alkanindiges sp. WGS2144 TaxID=3366808 RepID=UPI00375139A2